MAEIKNIEDGEEMRPITEEQRQALIESANEMLTRRNIYGSDIHCVKAIAEIAIASLTVDVFMHGISDPDGDPYFSECCVDDDGSGVSDEVCALNDCETDCIGGYRVTPLYTSPSVPVIQLPEKYTDYEDFLTDSEQGYNDAIDEIKRLNGIS